MLKILVSIKPNLEESSRGKFQISGISSIFKFIPSWPSIIQFRPEISGPKFANEWNLINHRSDLRKKDFSRSAAKIVFINRSGSDPRKFQYPTANGPGPLDPSTHRASRPVGPSAHRPVGQSARRVPRPANRWLRH